MKITVPAAHVIQGKRGLYATSLTVRDLMMPDFYSINQLSPETGQSGYQRILQPSRAEELSKYIIQGQDIGDVFLPTSIFLATEKDIDFNKQNNTISFDTDIIGSFIVVDGQHRLEGLSLSSKKDPRVLDFQIPVNIAYKLPYKDQMVHFLIVNKMQKSVDQGIEQQIISVLTKLRNTEIIPNMPRKIKNDVGTGGIARALDLVKYLNKTENSPWKGKILMPNQMKKEYPNITINSASFTKVIKKNIMVVNHPLLLADEDPEEQRKIFLNYWKAISDLLDPKDGTETVLYKHLGVALFAMFCTHLFSTLNATGLPYTVDAIKETLKNCFENMEGDYAGVGNPRWWL
ncbi:MAG: DGQHR domain-containing protein, partial [Proteobacteria bacterium]|nr:DGQHR domain-containing protein [Pseudomonadota bacterium]